MSRRPDERTPVRRASLLLLALVAAFALLAACATEASEVPAGTDLEGDAFDPSGDLDEEIDEPIAPETGLDDEGAPTSQQVVEAAISDVEGFWARTFEDLYGA